MFSLINYQVNDKNSNNIQFTMLVLNVSLSNPRRFPKKKKCHCKKTSFNKAKKSAFYHLKSAFLLVFI